MDRAHYRIGKNNSRVIPREKEKPMELIISEIIIPVLSIVLLALASAGAKKIYDLIGLKIEDNLIEQAVHFAEEKGRAYLAEHGEKLPSHEKLDLALAYLWDGIPQAKKDSYEARLSRKIEAAVNRLFHVDEN